MSKRRETTERGGYGTRGRGSLRAEASRVSASSVNRRCLPQQPSASAQGCWPSTTCPHRFVRFRHCDGQSCRRGLLYVACPRSLSSIPQRLRRGLPRPRRSTCDCRRRRRSLLSGRWQSTAQEPSERLGPRLRHGRGEARANGAENARRQSTDPRDRRSALHVDRWPGRKTVKRIWMPPR